MQPEKQEKKQKKLKELFVQELARIRGGTNADKDPDCPKYTTYSCREEAVGCSGC